MKDPGVALLWPGSWKTKYLWKHSEIAQHGPNSSVEHPERYITYSLACLKPYVNACVTWLDACKHYIYLTIFWWATYYVDPVTTSCAILLYHNTSPLRHWPVRWITPLTYRNVSLIRHHAHSSNAFPFPQIGTAKAWCFPIRLVQSPRVKAYLRKRCSMKCWQLRFTLKHRH